MLVHTSGAILPPLWSGGIVLPEVPFETWLVLAEIASVGVAISIALVEISLGPRLISLAVDGCLSGISQAPDWLGLVG